MDSFSPLSLPPSPGLARRLAYGELVRARRTPQLTIRGRQSTTFHFNPIYEELVTLSDVKVGVSLRTLVQQSELLASDGDDFCCICQEHTHTSDIMRRLICKHRFHAVCIERWLCEHKTCPICKHYLD
jgi:hypothetical protein